MTKPVNVASVQHLSIFRYPGGKTWFIPWIRRWLGSLNRKPLLLVEPFGGGGVVSLTAVHEKLVSKALIVEKDADIALVWRTCLSKDATRLSKRIREFHLTKKNLKKQIAHAKNSADRVEKALAVILLNRVRRGGVMAPGAGMLKRGENGNGLGSRWYPETLAKRVKLIHSLRHQIVFREGDGLDAIKEFSKRKSVAIFADPPYQQAGRRLYKHWKMDHQTLLMHMAAISGDFIITYDNVPKIRRLADKAGLKRTSVPMKNTGHALKRELVIGHDLNWVSS